MHLSSILRKLVPCFVMGVFILGCASHSFGQKHASNAYLQRAESMYTRIWQYYRVPAHEGLFTENFPSRLTDTLTYFQGGGVQEKKVSFLWPFSGMISATNVLLKIPAVSKKYLPYRDSLIVGLEKYRDTLRSPTGYQAYPVSMEKVDRYYDDNALVGIDYMELYSHSQNPVYLRRAKAIFGFILSGWSEDLGGGVPWLEGHHDQKPACTNGMATLVALKIYQATKDPFYLNWGKRFYGWMQQNLLDSTGVYSNDKKHDGQVNRTFWTYNSGSMLESAVLLYQITGEKQYLQQAKQLAKDAHHHFRTVPHPEELTSHVDLPWFVTVLFRGYEALYRQDGNDQYIASVEKDLNYAWQHSRDASGFITHSWMPTPDELKKPKWLLDEACIAELYARLSILRGAGKK